MTGLYIFLGVTAGVLMIGGIVYLVVRRKVKRFARQNFGTSDLSSLMRAAQGWAAMQGRSYILPDDVKAVCMDVLAHRVIVVGSHLSQGAAASSSALGEVLASIPVPTEER